MEYSQLFEKAADHYKKKIPFVLFSLPDEPSLKGAFQKENASYLAENFDEESFVLAPFNLNDVVFQILYKNCDVHEVTTNEIEQHPIDSVSFSENTTEKERYMNMVANAIKKINSEHVHKIVVSREKKLAVQNFNLTTLCTSLFSQYEDAFRYVWYHPDTGIWCGATPELLLQTNQRNFSTMALAGTQRIDDKMMIQWSVKEKLEQQWVTDAIIDCLENKTAVLKVSKTKTHIAGNLAHLKTDISGVLNTNKATLMQLAKALHPTPAICGTPRSVAMQFITQHENYNRSFYAGFLGPVGEMQRHSKLFVNLRCMAINDSEATLYAGGGITIDSNPEAEWDETHNKLQTIAKVLQPLL
ncbi:chorismate-binding protein [Rasiella rasia]|uniref:isochorismate synthase n=1 Tax=Rasiella rasia TaxID=2744027 RepID=A0A6G6GHP5_9FLAO|nr:isochorismate synthase [Rasiella rasia]QIE58068.1 chorismate-binding protein [Rasiella rasia]